MIIIIKLIHFIKKKKWIIIITDVSHINKEKPILQINLLHIK